MKIGDMIFDSDYGMYGLVVENIYPVRSGDMEHLIGGGWRILYDDGELGIAHESEMEVIYRNESR
tara:strand:+ start:7077 stop:7271 length:195 start_codon:yes stop_codon:yes gene_type:complete